VSEDEVHVVFVVSPSRTEASLRMFHYVEPTLFDIICIPLVLLRFVLQSDTILLEVGVAPKLIVPHIVLQQCTHDV